MIDKSLQRGYLYISIAERYTVAEDGIYVKSDAGLHIPKTETKRDRIPFEVGEVLQVGRGLTEDGIELSKIVKPGDKVRIFPRRGTDFDLTSEGKDWVTFINYNDIISIL